MKDMKDPFKKLALLQQLGGEKNTVDNYGGRDNECAESFMSFMCAVCLDLCPDVFRWRSRIAAMNIPQSLGPAKSLAIGILLTLGSL